MTLRKEIERIIEEWYDNPLETNSKDLSYFAHDYKVLSKAILDRFWLKDKLPPPQEANPADIAQGIVIESEDGL